MNIKKSKDEGYWIVEKGKTVAWVGSLMGATRMAKMVREKDRYFPRKKSIRGLAPA